LRLFIPKQTRLGDSTWYGERIYAYLFDDDQNIVAAALGRLGGGAKGGVV